MQLISLYQILYNIKLDKSKGYSNYEHNFYLGHEYLAPFNTTLKNILDTVGGDITIEYSNPKYNDSELEDIYQVKLSLFFGNEGERTKKTSNEIKDHLEYFHRRYDDIDKKMKQYKDMSKEDILENIKDEKDFQLFTNLHTDYMYIDYEISEKATLRMNKIASNDDERQIYLSCLLTLYTSITHNENKCKLEESKLLMERYEKMLSSLNRHKEKENEFLLAKAFFHLKSKSFSDSLINFDEYFNKYIEKQKKKNYSLILLI